MAIPRGTTTAVNVDGTVAPANASNTWEVYKDGALIAGDVTPGPNGWNVAADGTSTSDFLVTVPAGATVSTGSAYQYRHTGTGTGTA